MPHADEHDDLDLRLLDRLLLSGHAEVFAAMAARWAADVGSRVDAVAAASPDQAPARLHELRSLATTAGARGLARAAAEVEQAVERGAPLTDADVDRLRGVAVAQRDAITLWWRSHGGQNVSPANRG